MKVLLSLLLLFISINAFSQVPKEILGERKAKYNVMNYTGIFSFERDNEGVKTIMNCTMFTVYHEKKQRMLTAKHCCDGISKGVSIVKVHPVYDICEIKVSVPPPFTKGIELSKNKVNMLDTVYTAGLLSSEGAFFSKGYVRLAYDDAGISTSFMKPGMSGGPTFDEDGNLYGVNSMYYKESNNTMFVPVNIIKEFLK